MDTDPSFSLNDFRKWLSGERKCNVKLERNTDVANGVMAECRLGITRLQDQMQKSNPELANYASLAKTFKDNGAKVISTDGDSVTLEANNSRFVFPKQYIKNR